MNNPIKIPTHLIVIIREGVPEVTPIYEGYGEENMMKTYDNLQTNWTESFLCKVEYMGTRNILEDK